jgi:lysozyme
MKTSEMGIAFIKQFEGLSLQSYICSGGKWTIGWGTTEINGMKIKYGDIITIEQAETFLKNDLKKFENLVNTLVKVEINQNQFDALVSHTYNTGGSETLFNLINSKQDKQKIKNWFEKTYITAQGKLLRGLIIRRSKEAELYFSDKTIYH